MKIAVCYKWVLNEADIRVNEGSRTLNTERSAAQINEYDRLGLAAGSRLKDAVGAELIGITCGAACAASAKEALARGPDAVFYLEHPALAQADSGVTSKVLAAAIAHLGGVDVVICSEGSSDDYAQQVGPRLAALLGFACISYAGGIAVAGEALRIERKLEDGGETVEVTGPVVISVVPEIGEAPIPGVKQILGAKKKPSTALTTDMLGLAPGALLPQLTIAGITAPMVSRGALRLNPEGTDLPTAAADLVKHLMADGVL